MSDEYKTWIDGVYYDVANDHLVLLLWVGNRFHLEADFNDCWMKAKSKPFPSTQKAGLIYVGEL